MPKLRFKAKKERFYFSLTLLRVLLALVVSILVLSGRKNISVLFFGITALIAFFDSIIIKRLRSDLLKSVLDFFADRFLIIFVSIALAIKSLLPVWAMLIFCVREILAIAVVLVLFYRDSRREFKPTILGKISLFFQIIALIPVAMARLDWVLIWIAIVLTIISGIESLFKSEFKLVKKKKEFDEFKILRLMKFADVFTLTNVIFGIISVLFAVKGWYATASLMLLLAVISDYFDGKIAKAMNQQNEFGKELDSLADTVSFGVAPAIFGFMMIQTPLALISFTIFLFCGILRLARYNIMDLKGEFRGLPITFNGIIIPIIYFLRVPIIAYPYIYIVLGLLMVSSIKVKKI